MFANTAPIVDIDLPAPIILPCPQLFSLHLSLFCIDYLVSSHEDRIVPTILHGARLRVILAMIHFLVPMAFACPNFYINGMLTGAPWFIASKIVQHASKKDTKSSFSIIQLVQSITSMHPSKTTTNQEQVLIRIQGLAKVSRGIFKWAFMKSMIDPHIPSNYGPLLLAMPYWSLYSLWITALLGVKVYCLCGLSDLSFGFQQFLLGISFMDMFNSPLLAHSLRDFWSHRWNLPVKNLLHDQFFAVTSQRVSSQSHYIKKSQKGSLSNQHRWYTSRVIRGLFIFFVSGLFHEVMLAAVIRKVTLEQILFFTLHGVLVLMEIKLLNTTLRPDKGWMHRTICMLFNFALLVVTGRLFLAPYIRTDLITRIFG